MRRVYNRYIPQNTDYVPVSGENPVRRTKSRSEEMGQRGAPPRQRPVQPGLSALLGGKGRLSALLAPDGEAGGISALLKSLKLGDWDSGDLLLLLIILFLLAEGDDLELVIALGLALMMGLGEEREPLSAVE